MQHCSSSPSFISSLYVEHLTGLLNMGIRPFPTSTGKFLEKSLGLSGGGTEVHSATFTGCHATPEVTSLQHTQALLWAGWRQSSWGQYQHQDKLMTSSRGAAEALLDFKSWKGYWSGLAFCLLLSQGQSRSRSVLTWGWKLKKRKLVCVPLNETVPDLVSPSINGKKVKEGHPNNNIIVITTHGARSYLSGNTPDP